MFDLAPYRVVCTKTGRPGLLIGALALLVLQLFSLMAGNELNVARATKMIDKFEDSFVLQRR
jgi:hypothetical protein